ncbi:alpha/beta hydrolase [Streptomyces sp. H27-C3]|uniref:alpha/beta hydrolase n=1 Tax=Streptomyces sp. H27-C3 TaxID=3046305 RepID=UPI0024B9C456|nr:alpha/beta hydrolase [Streptomyces sp. H27-C3]MDJ0462927.1 alpha/beta hydrolase [Streptomyces sp. H27-C3]
MTSFDSSPTLNAWRALLALAVVFVMLATTGWTAVRHHKSDADPRAASLASWARGGIDGRELPDAGLAPASLARFFATLSASQREHLVDRYPLVVGNMNGAPLTLRYRANHRALAQASTAERSRTHDPKLSAVGRQTADRRWHRFGSLMGHGRQILAFDPAGSGRVAEVFGDLGRAKRVSVVVPGVDTTAMNFERTERKYTAPVGMATSLYAAERAASPGARTAVIAWADYTAPSGLGMDAVIGKPAMDGSQRLNSLVAGLPGGSKVSLFCHSYGSVVCGVAAPSLPPRVADIVAFGSPGMRVENAKQLKTGARVWATRDGDDWIQDVPYLEVGGLGHGADPVSPEFGARVVSAAGAVGHTGYFAPGTESLNNFAEIGVGSYRTVNCASGDGACRSGISGAEEV